MKLFPAWIAVLCCLSLHVAAQQNAPDAAHADLVLWLVGQPAGADSPKCQPYATFHEQTAGSFGQPASTVGRASSDMGRAAGSFGMDASTIGRTAGSVGSTAGSFGTASSNIGQTAGDYGIAASQLGTLASTVATQAAPELVPVGLSSSQWSSGWLAAFRELHTALPQMHVSARFVRAEDLQAQLQVAQAAGAGPDVLVGEPLPTRETDALLPQQTLAHLGVGPSLPGLARPLVQDALVLAQAPHPAAARAFVLWLGDRACPGCGSASPIQSLAPEARTAAVLAINAAEDLLRGQALGAVGDPSLALMDPFVASLLALAPPDAGAAEGLTFRTTVLRAAANDRFAVVVLRTAAVAPGGLGVLHPMVVLRRTGEGSWRVLQISLNVPGDLVQPEWAALRPYTEGVKPERLHAVRGVALASPPDGDSRTGAVDLWWDDPGDAGLLAVEWQVQRAGRWSDTQLQMVPDTGPKLQVRVPAAFAVPTAQYRWRVWAVGEGGMLTLSGWRRLLMLP